MKQEGSESPRIKQEGSESSQAKQESSESAVDRLIQGVRVACDAERTDLSMPPPAGFTKIEQRLSEIQSQWGTSPVLPWQLHVPLAVYPSERTDEWFVNSLIDPLFSWGVAHSLEIFSLHPFNPPPREASPIPEYAKVMGTLFVYRMDNKPLLPEQLSAMIWFLNKFAPKPRNTPQPSGRVNLSGEINIANAAMEIGMWPQFFKMWWVSWKKKCPGGKDIPSPYEM